MHGRIPILSVLAALASIGLAAQSAPSSSSISMAQALAEAASVGGDLALVAKALDVARLQRSLDLAKQGLSLGASGSYSLADAIGEDATSGQQSLVSKAEAASLGTSSGVSSYSGPAQSAQGSLALAGPRTKLTLSAAYTAPPSSASSTYPIGTLGLAGTQTLWDGYAGGQSQATLEKSLLTFRAKELSAELGRSVAVAKVKQAYIALLAAQRDLAIKTQVLGKQKKLLAQIQAIYAIQQATAIDLKTAQINARSAEIDVATADKTARLANERLAVLMGRAAGDRFAAADIPDPQLPASSIDEAIAIGIKRRIDLAQYDLSARSVRIDAKLARAQSYPTISLTAGAGLAMGWADASIVEEALSLGARISAPILDSGAADIQVKLDEDQAALFDSQAAQTQKTLASDIRDYYEGARLLAEKVELAKQSADLAEAQFELVKAQNAFGTATTQDLLTASVTAATAEVGYGTAKNSYLLAVLSLETAMGL